MKIKSYATALVVLGVIAPVFESIANNSHGTEILEVQKGGVENIVYNGNGPRLRIATYNIGKNEASDNVSDFSQLNTAIKMIDADVIVIPEVDNKTKRSNGIDQMETIAKANHMYSAFGKAMEFDGGEYGVGILSKYKINKSQVVNLNSGNAEKRIALISEINIPKFKSPVIIIGTHLDWQTDPSVRIQQARSIMDVSVGNVASNFENMPSAIKILAGDFNATDNDQSINELNKYFTLVENKNSDYRTWPAVNPAIDIDHILTYKGQKWEVIKSYVPTDSYKFKWSSVSDHLPNIAEIKLIEQ